MGISKINRVDLPIDSILPKILESLERDPCLVLQASPGTGKTTRVPPTLLRAGFRRPLGEIIVLEPRRLAAKWAARRVAEELGESVGQTVGYQFRFERVTGKETRLRFLTEGMLMRQLLSDSRLANVDAVVLDEFHERHLHGDVALGYLRWLQKTHRPELRLIVMSATLDAESVARFLGDCPVLSIEARLHPVEVEYLASAPTKPLEKLVRESVAAATARDKGDVLVFLPGMAEIRRAESALEDLVYKHNLLVLPLHGELAREEQDRAMAPAPRNAGGEVLRKVILATNVAETSLTIEGVTSVVDSGLHRVASYSWWSGVPTLRTRPISRASATQRAGRAGRTAPGHCFRLYTKADYEGRAPFGAPEIQRADLCQTYLELKTLGIADPERFEWFEAPEAGRLQAARELLHLLGAFEMKSAKAPLTTVGRRLAEIPAHPRLGRMLLTAEREGALDEAATLAALIAEGELEGIDAMSQVDHYINSGAVKRVREQLLGVFGKTAGATGKTSKQHALSFAALTGFPDRVVKKRALSEKTDRSRGAGECELLLATGGSARVENAGLISASELFVVLDARETQAAGQARGQLRAQSVCLIQPEWLFDLEPSLLVERDELVWEAERERVVQSSRMDYGNLILTETRMPPKDQLAASRFLLKEGLGLDLSQCNINDLVMKLSTVAEADAIQGTFARLELLAKHAPEFEIPSPTDAAQSILVVDAIAQAATGCTRLSELRELDWPVHLFSAFCHGQEARIERLVPLHYTFANGRRARIYYNVGMAPSIESRLQDFFGMTEGPAILNGRVPLTLHLLAPNQRAVQITTDLVGFWKRAYPSVRKELARQYPRHAWPEDPVTAAPPPMHPPRRR